MEELRSMLGAIKKLFGMKESRDLQSHPTSASPAAPQHSAPEAPRLETARGPRTAPALVSDVISKPIAMTPTPAESKDSDRGSDVDVLQVPFTSIIQSIPKDLHGRLAPGGAAGAFFSITRKTVLDQLAKGAVKVAFGELRKSAPANLLINS